MNFSVNVLGLAGCGKSTFLSRLQHQAYVGRYSPTWFTNVIPITFQTSAGPITVNFTDQKCQFDTVVRPADGAIYMIDYTSKLSLKHAKDFERKQGPIPSITVVNKADIAERKIRTPPEGSIEVSSKSCYGISDSVQALLRQLTHNNELTLIW